MIPRDPLFIDSSTIITFLKNTWANSCIDSSKSLYCDNFFPLVCKSSINESVTALIIPIFHPPTNSVPCHKSHIYYCFVIPDKRSSTKVHLVDNFSGSESLKPKLLQASDVSLIVSAETLLLQTNCYHQIFPKSFQYLRKSILIILVAHLSVSLVLEN